MLRGFFDESNRNSKDEHFLIAGWTGAVEEWEKFTTAWNECLTSSPAIRYFKMSEANVLNGEFQRFTRQMADAKKMALAKVISIHDLRGYLSSANHQIMANKPKELKKMMATRLYDWVFMNIVCMVLVDRIEREDLQSRIDFIFDHCSELRACIESYNKIRPTWTPRMQLIAGDVASGDDHELAGLQAADMLVGELSLHIKTTNPSQHYMAMMTKHEIVRSDVGSPKKLQEVQNYAREVFTRSQILTDMLADFKKAGINLSDYK